MKKLYFHIGFHKTGSTAIQEWLIGHAEQLKCEGVLYPSSGIPTGKPYHRQLYDDIRNQKDDSGLWGRLYEEISANSCPSVLLSDEAWSAPWIEDNDISALKEKLDSFEVTILVVLRNPTDYFISRYRHAIYMRSKDSGMSFKRFVRDRVSGENEMLKQLNTWGEFFGKNNIRVLIYDSVKKNGLLGSQFLSMLGVDLPNVQLAKANVSRSDEILKALRMLMRIQTSLSRALSKSGVAEKLFVRLRNAVSGQESRCRLLFRRILNFVDHSDLVPSSEIEHLQELVADWPLQLADDGWLTDEQARQLAKEI